MRRTIGFCVAAVLGLSVVVQTVEGPPPLGLDRHRPSPAGNRLTLAKVTLGRQLFFDPLLSREGRLSCAGCHDPGRAFAGHLRLALGTGGAVGLRNVPTLVNRAWGSSFFWDGRAATLEQQVLQPILNPAELGSVPDVVLQLARSDRYRPQFEAAFGSEPTIDHVTRALASYVRTILAGDSPYDRYSAGERTALGASAVRGLGLFGGKGRCATCHAGPLLSDERFHNTGVAWQDGILVDRGRGAITGASDDLGAFKTPTLREVTWTAPYMHDGSLATLADVVDFYDGGGRRNPALDPTIRPLGLTAAEKQDLLAFLTSLSGVVIEGFEIRRR